MVGDVEGVPLATMLTAANRHDAIKLIPLIVNAPGWHSSAPFHNCTHRSRRV